MAGRGSPALQNLNLLNGKGFMSEKRTSEQKGRPAEPVAAALVFFAGLVLYFGSARPDMMWGDSADFALCAHYLAVPHPTGYPLITLAGKLALYIPVGTIGFRIGLLSAFIAAALLGIFFRLTAALTRSVPAALYAALILALSSFLWDQALAIEVYALNLMFCMFLLGLMLPERRGGAPLAAFFFIGALGLGNHGTLVFPALMMGAIGLFIERRRFARAFFTGGFLILLGLALYICLPLFSARSPLFDWNHPVTISNLLYLMSGYDFWVTGAYSRQIAADTARTLAGSIAAQASAPFIAGLVAAFFIRGERLRKTMLIGTFALTAFFPIFYPTKEKESFFIISYAVFILLGAMGMAETARRWGAGKRAVIVSAALIALIAVHSGLLLNRNKDNFAARSDGTALTYNLLLLKSARRDALVFLDHVADDAVATPLYYEFAQGARSDVFFFHRLFLAFPWYRDNMRERARDTGHPALLPYVNLQKERDASYEVTVEEYMRLREGKTMNTVSIDIQTRKLWEANAGRVPMYINTTDRFRYSVLSRDVQLDLSGFLFAMNGMHAERPLRNPPPAAGPPNGRVFNALMGDYFVERAYWFAAQDRNGEVVASLLAGLKYRRDAWMYGSLADAYDRLGDAAMREKYRRMYQRLRIKDYDLN
jgi:hypothetical protein